MNQNIPINSDVEILNHFQNKVSEIKKEISKIIVGQDDIIEKTLISIFSNGHCLLIGVPGLAKTLLVNTLAQSLGLNFNRVQFTPDLMPSDLIGTELLDENRQFKFIKGPLFANIILADEINRTPPKTQSALLESMQEKSITVAGKTYILDNPYFVLATQNPIEQEGTYPLPEAQLDRFMFNLLLDYPSFQEELDIVEQTTSGNSAKINTIINKEEILLFQEKIRKIPVPDNVLKYAVNLSVKSRPNNGLDFINEYVNWGAGPRASQYLIIGAKTNAAIKGKYSIDIEDVKKIAKEVLRHRIIRNYKAEAEKISTDNIIEKLMELNTY